MNHFEFRKKNVLSFLYFLYKNKKINNKMYDQLFHFNRLNNKYHEEKMYKNFIFHNYDVADAERGEIIRTLNFYGFIDEENQITETGRKYLEYEMENNQWFKESLEIFQKHYKGENVYENTTVNGFDAVTVNCFYKDYSK